MKLGKYIIAFLLVSFVSIAIMAREPVKGWMLLSDDMHQAAKTIKTAKSYGVNHLQLSHKIIHDLNEIKNKDVQLWVNTLIDMAHVEGIDDVLVWDHSLYRLDYYPARFRNGPGGIINLDNPDFWIWMKEDYRKMLALVPDVDGLVLTFIETGAYAEHQYSTELKTPEEKLAKVVNTIADVVIGECKKKLYIRTFAYSNEGYESTVGCIKHIERKEVALMIKETPHDFFLTHPDNPFVKQMDRPTIVEFDLGNEYSGQGVVAATWPEHVMKRWNGYEDAPNVSGYVARVDRYGDTNIIGTANEILLYAMKRAAEAEVSPEQIYDEFIIAKYGKASLPFIKRAFRKAFHIITSVYYTLGTNLTDHSSLNYDHNRWGYSRHVSGRWLNPPVVAVSHGVDRTMHYWKDIVNHIAPAHYKTNDSPLAVEVKEVMDSLWVEPGEKIDSTYFHYIVAEKAYGVQLAQEALTEISKTKSLLASEAYDGLYQLFYRTYLSARLHYEVCVAYFGSRLCVRGEEFVPLGLKKKIENSLKEIETVVQEMSLLKGKYPIGQYDWLHDAEIALQYKNKAKEIISEVSVIPSFYNEESPSRAEYFSWINNTNEGSTEAQTLANLDFFEWMRKEYGMQLDIYAFDAGLIDSKNIYGSMDSERFRRNFPNGLDSVYAKAKRNGIRLGLWGGPDGFGNTLESAEKRKNMLVSLCRDYDWALFKFDAVCGPLREEKEDVFVKMMNECRSYSPDLILLNHRLGLKKAEQCATTFLWEGRECYIDVNSPNTSTAVHHRVGAMNRGLVPGMKRLTEDHGVCLSSCLDYWDDELVIQAFNRSLLLAPQIYGNPWLLADHEFPKLARIFRLHRKYADILVKGMELPSVYGDYAVARGDEKTRLLTLRNLTWMPRKVRIKLDEEIGLLARGKVECRLFHPTERILGVYDYGDEVEVTVDPFRSLLFCVSPERGNRYGIGVKGIDYEVVKDVEGQPIELNLLGLPGDKKRIQLDNASEVVRIELDGVDVTRRLTGSKTMNIHFEGSRLQQPVHRKLAEMFPGDIPQDASALYEATVFAADNNAMEVRSLHRSGDTKIPQVQAARDAFFNQPTFVNRGIWDKNLFDGRMDTGFWPSQRKGELRIKGGCFRLDLGEVMRVDSLLIKVNNDYELQPLLVTEGQTAWISSDLAHWKPLLFEAGTVMKIEVKEDMRYLKLRPFPNAIAEVEVYSNGVKQDAQQFRANNLFADASTMNCVAAWKTSVCLEEIIPGSKLCVAVNGRHGVEGGYAAIKMDGRYIGASSRATSYPSNPWENVTVRSHSNYTYYFPLDESMKGKEMEVVLLAYDKDNLSITPEVWVSGSLNPYQKRKMTIYLE